MIGCPSIPLLMECLREYYSVKIDVEWVDQTAVTSPPLSQPQWKLYIQLRQGEGPVPYLSLEVLIIRVSNQIISFLPIIQTSNEQIWITFSFFVSNLNTKAKDFIVTFLMGYCALLNNGRIFSLWRQVLSFTHSDSAS